MQESFSKLYALTSKMYNHKGYSKKYRVSKLYNIAEPDKAYDEYLYLLNPLKSNETSHIYKMDQSNFRLHVCFSFLSRF